MKEDVKKFIELSSSDQDFQEKLQAALGGDGAEATDDKAAFDALIVPVAKEFGLDLSYEDLVEYAQEQAQELDLDELDQVAGGDEKRPNEREGFGWTACYKVGIGLGGSGRDGDTTSFCLVVGGGESNGCIGTGVKPW